MALTFTSPRGTDPPNRKAATDEQEKATTHTPSKRKPDADGKGKDELSVGAKTYVTKLAKEMIYGYDERVTTKYMDKGLRVEDESIDLYNAVHLTSYSKNMERKTNEWITGEADIVADNQIIEVGTPVEVLKVNSTIIVVKSI